MKFDSLPQEIIALILQSCDSFRQLQSLILVSKRICSVWGLNTGAILWHVGQAEILGFSDALIAIRATQIAKDALLEGRLPPDPFPVAMLSGDASRPSVAEVIQVQNLQRVAKFLEKEMLRDQDLFHCMPDNYDSERHEWARSRWSFWRDQFHQAIYRHIAAGAILYRTYHAPIVSDARPADFLAAFIATMESGEDLNVVTDGWFSASDRRYLATVPLYSIQDYHQCEKAFQPLEDLFVEESRKEALLKPPKRLPSRGPKRDDSRSLFSSFGEDVPIQNLENLDASHAETLFHKILHSIFMTQQAPQHFIPDQTEVQESEIKESPENTSSVCVIFFGSFVPLQITVRDQTEPSAALVLPGLESKTLKDSNYLGFQHMDVFLATVAEVGGIPNTYGDDRRPPDPQFYFAEHMLRKYFGLRFADTIYVSTIASPCAWDAFTRYGSVFTNLGLQPWYFGEDLFQSSDDPLPRVYYQNALE